MLAEFSRTAAALGVAAGVFPHEQGSLLFAEPLADQFIVVQQELLFFGERGVGGIGSPRTAAAACAKSQGLLSDARAIITPSTS